jgi:hypothetical protein
MSKRKDEIRSFVVKIDIVEDFTKKPPKKRSNSSWVQLNRKIAKEIQEKPVPEKRAGSAAW